MAYTEFDYKILVTQLRQYSDIEYAEFQNSLSVGSSFLYGVRVPKLRDMSRRIAARDWKGFLNFSKDNSYEEIMIHGLVIEYANCSPDEFFEAAADFVEKIDNWAICDTFSAGFKIARKEPERAWDFLMRYIDSPDEFKRRFVVVTTMNYFFKDDTVNKAMNAMIRVDKSDYYVMSAVAWALASGFVKYRSMVLRILTERALDPRTHNKTIQKCRESYRVSSVDKDILKSLRVNRHGEFADSEKMEEMAALIFGEKDPEESDPDPEQAVQSEAGSEEEPEYEQLTIDTDAVGYLEQ